MTKEFVTPQQDPAMASMYPRPTAEDGNVSEIVSIMKGENKASFPPNEPGSNLEADLKRIASRSISTHQMWLLSKP